MSIISYAQNFEDVMLWRALGHIEQGFYIDIGAQDPTIDSVSLAFHQNGWHGIHVEPTPHYAELLRQQRPGDTIIQAAVGNNPGLLRFFEIPNTGISTADPEIAQQHRERGFTVQETTVASVTLSAIFDTCPEEIHWLKIDVEGFEKNLLSSWGSSLARPWIVIVESTLPLTQIETHDAWEYLITKYGYSPVYFDGLNRYYVSEAHPELKAAFSVPPNVFDGFSLNGTASAPFHRVIEDRLKKEISETLTQNEKQKAVMEEEAKRLHASHSSLAETHAEHQRNWLHTEKALSEKNNQIKRELEALQYAQAQREREIAERTRSQSEQESVLHEQLSRLQQERVAREQALHEQTSLVRQEIETILRAQTRRELEVGDQLRQAQLLAEQDKAELIRKHSEQERALHHQHAEREKGYSEQASQTRQEVERLLQERIQREQQIAGQIIDLQQHCARETAELARSHAEQARALQDQLLEREKSFSRELLVRQQEIHQQHHSHINRAQEIESKLLTLQHHAAESAAEQARHHREQERTVSLQYAAREDDLKQQRRTLQEQVLSLQQERARREQEVGEQLSAIHQQALLEMAEQSRKHLEQTAELHRLHAEREQFLHRQLEAGKNELHHREQDWGRREKEHAEQTTQSRQTLDHLLREQTQREQEIGAQLLALHQETQQEKHQHARLKDACATLEAQLQEEIRSGQQATIHLRHLLAEVQQNLDFTHASLSWRMTGPLRKIAGLFGSTNNQTLAPLTSTRGVHASSEIVPAPAPSSTGDTTTPEPQTLATPESLSIQAVDDVGDHMTLEREPSSPIEVALSMGLPESLEPTISSPAYATATNMPTNVSTLSELLSYNDQQFVCCAYQTLLGRTPDPQGLSYYLDRVRSGFSKIEIIAQLRLSQEGKVYASSLPGLDISIEKYQKSRLPLRGFIIRWLNSLKGDHPIEKKLRAIENQIGLLHDQSAHRFDQLEAALTSLSNLVAQQKEWAMADSVVAPTTSAPAPAPAEVIPIPPSEPEGFNHLAPHAKDIYFHLKTEAFNRARRIV